MRCASSSRLADIGGFFKAQQREARDARCVEKDTVTRRLLDRLPINPRSFTAVLMPSLYGPEVQWLLERGARIKNLFAVERDANIHAALVTAKIPTTPRAMRVQDAIDHVPFEAASLVYLDFFGQPNADHLEALRKLFVMLLGRGSRLWITFGVNRGKTFSCALNRRLVGVEASGEAYVRAARDLAGDRAPKILRITNHRYKSSTLYHPMNFVLTEVQL